MSLTKAIKTSSTVFQDLFPSADTSYCDTNLDGVLLLAITAKGACGYSCPTSFHKKSRVTSSILTPLPLEFKIVHHKLGIRGYFSAHNESHFQWELGEEY